MSVPKSFIELPGFQVPSEFWPAYGYRGDARFVALWWTCCGDEAMVADGQVAHDAVWRAYLTLIDHPRNAALLRRPCPQCRGQGIYNGETEVCDRCWGFGSLAYDLGSSDTEATHWLVVDRQTYDAWIAPCRDAESFLSAQWPRQAPPEWQDLSEEQLHQAVVDAYEQAVGRFHRTPAPSIDVILSRMKEERAWLETLEAALAAL